MLTYLQHVIVDIVRVMAAFTDEMGTPNAPTAYYEWVNSPLDVTKTAVYCTVTLISDAIIVCSITCQQRIRSPTSPQIYRLFIVWNRNYLIAVVPFLAFFADIGSYSDSVRKTYLIHVCRNIFLVYMVASFGQDRR